jgi:hypothetical protein
MFGLAVAGVLALLWLWRVTLRQWSWAGLYASLGCLIGAGLNAAAPVRGFVDADYVGYTFGLVSAGRGMSVTLLAGAIFLSCAASALIAASRRSGQALWIVAATSAAMFVIIGVPTLANAVRDPSANAIQFGEYLTVPGAVGTAVLLLLAAAPFAVGALWGALAAMRPRD